MNVKDQIKNLVTITEDMKEKHFSMFSKCASYVGNGIYSINNMLSTDTEELFIMYIANREFPELDINYLIGMRAIPHEEHREKFGFDSQELFDL